MMYGLRHDLREVGEAIISGYTSRDEDPNLSTTLTKIAGIHDFAYSIHNTSPDITEGK